MKKCFVFIMIFVTAIVNAQTVKSGNPMLDKLFKLAADEVKQNINNNGTFYAGAKWQGVWTRDSAYSIDLSLALLFPENAEKTLNALLTAAESGRQIKQDTGTGGGYPISSDRIVWAMAAYRLSQLKSDDEYSRFVYDTAARALNYDLNVTFDPQTGLYRGETSFLDWREQTYPMSMDCNAIGNSFALGTNILYYIALQRMENMSHHLGLPDESEWHNQAEALAAAIRKHFSSDAQLCSFIVDNLGLRQYRGYDTLAVSLAILSEVVSGQDGYNILHGISPAENGMPVVSPQISVVEPYHNNAVWPFVQAYRILAAAKLGDTAVVENELNAMMSAVVKTGTFKENYQADNGDPDGTATNSDRQLWSDAGFLGVVLRGIAGLNVDGSEIWLQPVMPALCGGALSIQNVKVGTTTINIEIHGVGSKIASMMIDGKSAENGTIVRDGKTHEVVITMEHQPLPWNEYTPLWNSLAAVPISPLVTADIEKGKLYLEWNQPGSLFEILIDGKTVGSTNENWYRTKVNNKFAHIAEVQTVTEGLPTVFGTIVRVDDKSNTIFCEAEEAAAVGGTFSDRNDANMEATAAKNSAEFDNLAFNGRGYVSQWGANSGDTLTFTVNIKKAGRYAIDIRYQNGNGPINTGSGCGIAAVSIDGTIVRRLPLAQRGSWMDWGFSSAVVTDLPKGANTIVLLTDEYCHNERGSYNPVNVDLIRVARMSE